MALPNLLIVGAPKAGTTSLTLLLSQHPEIFFSTPKETRFFTRDYQKGVDYYEQTFFDTAGERVVGEADATYLCHPCVPERIEQLLGRVKIIAVLRNPVDRFWSGYLMGVRDGRFSTDPEDIVAVNLRQLEEYRQLERQFGKVAYEHIPWRSELLQNGDYADCLENYITVFGREQVLSLIFEHILADQQGELKKIYQFLGVEDHGLLSLPNVNTYRPTGVRRLLARPTLRRLLPPAVATRLFAKPTPSAKLYEQLKAYYSPQVRRTEELLGINLSVWW